jgi:uncharacterized protein (TIGR00251 family)
MGVVSDDVTGPFRSTPAGLLLAVRVTPKSSRNAVTGVHIAADGKESLAVKVSAPPGKGKANRAAVEVLAKAFDLPKSAFSIISGETDRHKVVSVTGNPAALEAVVARYRNPD